MLPAREFSNKSFKYNITKYPEIIEDDILREFKGRTAFPVYIGREEYFRNFKYYTANLIKWSSLKRLFDVVNKRCINMRDEETTISTDNEYLNYCGSLWSISRRNIPFKQLGNISEIKFN